MIDYVVVNKFMTSVLNLKSTDLLVFALVYGFNKDKEHNYKCEATNKYIADLCGCSSINVQKSLKNLKDKDLILIRLYKNNSRVIGVNWKVIEKKLQDYYFKIQR